MNSGLDLPPTLPSKVFLIFAHILPRDCWWTQPSLLYTHIHFHGACGHQLPCSHHRAGWHLVFSSRQHNYCKVHGPATHRLPMVVCLLHPRGRPLNASPFFFFFFFFSVLKESVDSLDGIEISRTWLTTTKFGFDTRCH